MIVMQGLGKGLGAISIDFVARQLQFTCNRTQMMTVPSCLTRASCLLTKSNPNFAAALQIMKKFRAPFLRAGACEVFWTDFFYKRRGGGQRGFEAPAHPR